MCLSYHYAFDAANLLKECLAQIQEVIEMDELSRRGFHASNSSLYDMKEVLVQAERQLFCYFRYAVQVEVEHSSVPEILQVYNDHQRQQVHPCSDLPAAVDFLRFVLVTESSSRRNNEEESGSPLHSFYPRRNVTDTLLFRLNVALQLCQLRIDDSRLVLFGCRRRPRHPEKNEPSSSALIVPVVQTNALIDTLLPLATGLLGITTLSLHYARQQAAARPLVIRTMDKYQPMLLHAARSGAALLALRWLHTKWRHMWMASKLVRSTEEIEEWSRHWALVQSTPPIQPSRRPSATRNNESSTNSTSCDPTNQEAALDAARSQRLIEYALHETPKTSFWHSQGELRFLMLKRAMDVFYASVGTAIDLTNGGDSSNAKESDTANNWQINVATAAAASFYSLTGARERAATVTSSSGSSRKLIQNAWGMVSLPAVKTLSLQASRLLKGAAVADRIEICGVHCFVLSKQPAPELAAAIKRNQRLHQRRKPIATLSTIDEQKEHAPATRCNSMPFARSCSTRYRQRDVIFHLTGGGFFAHIIATDLPLLLDWSAATHAVVICPEYALLPENTFPVALTQVENVYQALVSNQAVSALGFETNRIIVTGESAGGNLAASLCVSLCGGKAGSSVGDDNPNLAHPRRMPVKEEVDEGDDFESWHPISNSTSSKKDESFSSTLRMPDALMLSCPVLNLSLELTYSAVVGAEDPVLPSGLISAISDAYLPPSLGVSKKNPLASPFYASDAVLRQFPPTLLFSSSTDPLLDDSVIFNQRLRSFGVESDLIAAHNLPHAYWGLGTAGFPEACQVQERCADWLAFQLTRDGGTPGESPP